MKIAVNTSALTRSDLDFSELEKLGEVKFFGEIPREELYRIASDCDAIIVNKVIVDRALLDVCPKIRYVGVFATGYNVVDTQICRERGITVCNVPDYSTYAVAQHVFTLLLAFYGSVERYTRSVAEGDWVKSETFCYFPWETHELYGKVFGIYGYGNIGRRVARIADALGAKVIVCTRSEPKDCPYERVSWEYMLKNSDVLSLHCPLTPETAKIIDGRTLSLMKRSAILINTARGGLVDEQALANSLNSGKIAGACLDTVAEEPMRADNPLRTAKNCFITPHIAWVAHETRTRLLGIATDNLRAYISGKPQNVVV